MIDVNNYLNTLGDAVVIGPPSQPDRPWPLHRLRQVREQEGFSRRSMARKLGISEAEVQRQECETTDLPLSIVYQWAALLGIPPTELLAEPNDALSLPLLKRARLVRLIKTAMAIHEQTNHLRTKRTAQMMIDQLIEIMPELRDVRPWNASNRRRGRKDYGQAYTRRMPERMFLPEDEP